MQGESLVVKKHKDFYVAICSYSARNIPPKYGFHWEPTLKKWITHSHRAAYGLYEYADDHCKSELMRALDITIWNIPPLKWPENLKPYAHQVDAARWALARKGSYLAYEAGTGKTIIAALILNSTGGKAIIVCPTFLKVNWTLELKKWGIAPKTIQALDSNKVILDPEADYYILPTSLVHSEAIRSQLFEKGIKVEWLIVDEAHYFKNPRAQRTKSLLGERKKKGLISLANRYVALSGTPMPNRPLELFAITHSFAPHSIDFLDLHGYATEYCNAYEGQWGWDYTGASNLDTLNQKLTRDFMQVRKLTDCVDLPPMLPPNFIYLDDDRTKALLSTEMQALSTVNLNSLILSELEGDPESYHKLERLANGGSPIGFISELRHKLGLRKVKQASKIIAELIDDGEDVIAFTWHRDVAQLLAESLDYNKYTPLVITGETKSNDRQAKVDTFQTSKDHKLIIANIEAAGVGLNITKANRIVFVEASWTPVHNSQAISRAFRIGQTRNVTVNYLVYPDSLDHLILNAHLRKTLTIEKTLNGESHNER